MDRELELSLVRLRVLAEAAHAPIYGARLLERLTRRGVRIGFGTLYPLLHRLETERLLVREVRVEDGRVRKYYQTTPAGRTALAEALKRLAEVQQEFAELTEERSSTTDQPIAPVIDLASFRAWQTGTLAERPTLLDVRSGPEYHAGHLPGAHHVPYEELDARLEELERARPVVTYCTMRHRGSSRSERAAKLLRGHGFEAWALDGGLPTWVSANLPLEQTGTET